jgi:hypothetical protein
MKLQISRLPVGYVSLYAVLGRARCQPSCTDYPRGSHEVPEVAWILDFGGRPPMPA